VRKCDGGGGGHDPCRIKPLGAEELGQGGRIM